MEVPDVEGIRLALLDPESRLRRMDDGPPVQHHPRIERLRIRGTDFFDNVEIPFNPCLTTVIGGRGTGKSTIIEYLRHVLDRARPEDFPGVDAEEMRKIRENVEKVLAKKSSRNYGETPGTLLPDYEIDVDVVVVGRRYRVCRTSHGITVQRDPDTANAEVVPLDVRALISPRILSQGQIARIARDPVSQRSELDALIDPAQLEEVLSQRRMVLERMEQLQKERKRLSERLRQLPAKETELQKVCDQIAFLENVGRSDVLTRFQAFERERVWLDTVILELESQATSLDELSAIIRRTFERLLQAPSDGPSKDWVNSVSRLLRERVHNLEQLLRTEAAALRELAHVITAERGQYWQTVYDTVRQEYEGLRQQLQERGIDFTQHAKLLQQRSTVEREVAELRDINTKLVEVERAIHDARKELVRVHERRLELRRKQAKVLEELDADVRIDVLPFKDRQDLYARREEWFAGTGVQERDWEKLMNYVFGDANVPERLMNLVIALREDVLTTAERGQPPDEDSSRVASLLRAAGVEGISGRFYRALDRGDRIRLDDMERFLPEDAVEVRVRSAGGAFTPISTGSVGQRSTAILSLLLSAGDQPLIIDQPEDDLDNRYVYDVVVGLLRRKKFTRQIVVVTHNANIPVNGDAELIIALDTENRMGKVSVTGSIDRKDVKEQVSEVMEGSVEAFRLRRERYGF